MCFSQRYKTFKLLKKNIIQTEIDYLFRSPGPGFTYCFNYASFRMLHEFVSANVDTLSKFRWHDWVIYAILRNKGTKWHFDETPHSVYRLHEKNDTGINNSLGGLIWRCTFLLNGEYRREVIRFNELGIDHPIITKLTSFTLLDRLRLIPWVPKMRSSFFERVALLVWVLFGK